MAVRMHALALGQALRERRCVTRVAVVTLRHFHCDLVHKKGRECFWHQTVTLRMYSNTVKLEVARKKMKHQARCRQDALLANFLLDFASARGETLDAQDIEHWQELMYVDEEFLMNLVADKVEEEDIPKELNTPLLHKMREYMTKTFSGSRNPFSALD
mmetsp:Transcript_95661/g.175153  ORF Transcript_95661/g.175153 Transcript_95661/m.175153 type:complete len:158 (+) Transcript_95661:67-540(+)